jgi:Zn-dependent peptidase ImmA (M78 family)
MNFLKCIWRNAVFKINRGGDYMSAQNQLKNEEQKAKELLETIGVQDQIPIRIGDICDYLGLQVKKLSDDFANKNNLAGAFVHDTKTIFVADASNIGRMRFTVAHEIAHAILHPKESAVDYRNGGSDPKEREADSFAAYLLMPTPYFTEAWKAYGKNISEIADYFKVSLQAVKIRAEKLALS